MTVHLQKRIERLKRKVMDLGLRVERNLHDSIQAVEELDGELGLKVAEGDGEIDEQEIELEEDCLAILALEQPVAFDLRFVISTLKMNVDLERIGDLAANIGEQAVHLAKMDEQSSLPFDLTGMARLTEGMLHEGLEAMINMDLDSALSIIDRDDQVDEIYSRMFEQFQVAVREDPSQLDSLMRYLTVARQLERAADHACNIAEDVVYVARGEIVRHGAHEHLG